MNELERVAKESSDLPHFQNRHDPEVDALMEPVNPHEVVSTLNQAIKEGAREREKG
jgi:hypothetical protein